MDPLATEKQSYPSAEGTVQGVMLFSVETVAGADLQHAIERRARPTIECHVPSQGHAH